MKRKTTVVRRGMSFAASSMLCVVLWLSFAATTVCHGASRRQSAQEWWRLTATNAPLPRVLVHDDEIRFYFPNDSRPIGFIAKLGRERLPTAGYQVSSALLRLKRELPAAAPGTDGWREPVIIAEQEWRVLATNLLAGLTPATPGHAKYYRGLLADRLLYRDLQARAISTPIKQAPQGVIIDHRYSIEESLQILAQVAEPQLVRNHPNHSLFLLIVHPSRSPQPLLIDTARHRCFWLSSAGLFEPDEPSFPLALTAQGISALVLESNGLALIKNPVSSAARLGNLLVETFLSLLRLPLSKPVGPVPPLNHAQGMDLRQWEEWLDMHTSTERDYGLLRLLIDGERFFPRFQGSISNATDHVHINVYIFDNDDVAVDIADQLRQRSAQVKVDIIIDRLASMAAARIPPATPPSKPYVPPASISAYLRKNSNVRVRPFLNSFCSYNHSKVYLVDGTRGWLGGMNIGREYRSEWHDMMVELEGPVVDSLEEGFRLDWAHASLLGDLAYLQALLAGRPHAKATTSTQQWIQMRLLPTTTLHKPFAKAVLQSLRNAKSYIYVENPYLFDKQVMANLVHARDRGVDVRVILPHVSDSHIGSRAELIAANYLVGQGVRVFFYPGMTHVKALLVDDWACVGSGNLNQFSLRLCQEHNVATSDPAFSVRLKHDLFEEDFTHCYELTEPVPVEWGDFLADFLLEGI
jgi:cardiolipin synthase